MISTGLLQLLGCMTLELCLIEEHVRLQALLVLVAFHGMLQVTRNAASTSIRPSSRVSVC